MARTFRVLAATDGSAPARAALKSALEFPWPEPSSARGVIALGGWSTRWAGVRAAAVRALYAEVGPTKRLLARRWPEASVVALHERPAQAILSEARRFGAQAIAVGWRGHSGLRRRLAGSVSRELAARARVPVLVARHAPTGIRRIVIGFDGSAGARRALRFASRLQARRGSHALLVSVIDPLPLPAATSRFPAGLRASLSAEVAKRNRALAKAALRRAKVAAALLERAGWAARIDVRIGAPLEELLEAAGGRRGTVLVVGARATRGLSRLLLGSVAEGALDHARNPVVIVP
jgi:nucleotide-binding universal stress UspA family protein